jgi:polyhydroxyalkanoate synthesis regulator phasin
MQDALRTYLGLAMGLTETSRKQVRKVVKDAFGRGNATAEQVRALTTDLMAANSANRDALVKLVKYEVDRALGVVGLATAEEVANLTARLHALEAKLREAQANVSADASAQAGRLSRTAAAKSPPRTGVRSARATAAKSTGRKTAPAKATKSTAKATKAATTTRTRATKASRSVSARAQP